jgi:ABC-type Fe3+-hydroxamate transport system substrate-binding protein
MSSETDTRSTGIQAGAQSSPVRQPGRIISLVPSLTELVFHLGLGHHLVGRTRFCIHPEEETGGVEIIGGTKNPRINKIKALKPDIVIANREENRKEDVDAISHFAGVLVTDIATVDEALQEMLRIGDALGRMQQAAALVDEIRKEMPGGGGMESLRALYMIWRDPWMAAGGDTYIHDVMQLFGLENVCAGMDRYPQLTEKQIDELAPQVILLSSEPYPFREKHVRELADHVRVSQKNPDNRPENGGAGHSSGQSQQDAPQPDDAGSADGRPATPKILTVDGEWFSWYGPRMLPSFRALAEWRQKL